MIEKNTLSRLNLFLQKFELAPKTQLKKNQKFWVREHHKNVEKAKKEEEDAAKRNKNLEEAKKLILSEDSTLPPATLIKIKNASEHRNLRIKMYGWVHRLRRQGICSSIILSLSDGFHSFDYH